MLNPPLYHWSYTCGLGLTVDERRYGDEIGYRVRDTGDPLLYVTDNETFATYPSDDISFELLAATVARAKAVLDDLEDASREDV